MDYKKTLTGLTSCTAVSGYENTITDYIVKRINGLCDNVEVDAFYNIIGFKKGIGEARKKILVTAHVDEIGLMVKKIDERGFVSFTNIGGIDSRILPAQEVIIHGKTDVYGIIGAKPPHLVKAEELKNAVEMSQMTIDTGMSSKELREKISVGDVITFKTDSFVLNNNIISSKSVDNRGGVTALIGVMEKLQEIKHKHDIYFVCTTQEEVKLTGAANVAYKLKPDLAVVIDACHGDMPSAPKEQMFKLGNGSAIGIGPNLHKEYTRVLMDTAREEGIPWQTDVEPGNTGTEAWAIQVSRSGIPTVLLSIPVRYMHTPIETVHIEDIKQTAKLIAAFIRR